MKAKFLKKSKSSIDFTKWKLVTSDEVSNIIHGAMSELVKLSCEYELEFDFPYTSAAVTQAEQEKTSVKPLAIVATVPLGSSDMDGPRWELDFADNLRKEIEYLDGNYSYNDAGILQAWGDELQSLIDEIDAQLERVKSKGG